MPGLDELGSLLGMDPPKKDDKKEKIKGYDGATLRLKIRVEKRRGKPVTIVWGFLSHPKVLIDLLTKCKKQLGAGGQIVDQSLEFQGDHTQRLKAILEQSGYLVA